MQTTSVLRQTATVSIHSPEELPDTHNFGRTSSGTSSGPWLQVVSHLDPKYGGLSSAVPELGSAIVREANRPIHLAGFCLLGEHYTPKTAPGVNVEYLPLGRVEWLKNRSHLTRLRELLRASNGLHVHGLWQQSSAAAAPLARKLGRRYVVSAHGMLESWAMANKRWKKAIYMNLIERENLRGAACLHALTQAEAEDYRQLGLNNPVAVIPNGVHIPRHLSAELFFEQFPALRRKRLLLFLGRIHFKKGLDILCQAWARISGDPDLHLVLAGPDFENTRAGLERLIDSLKVRNSVTFTGMLKSDLKWSALAASEAFVLPSYSEGLSVSVLEAMGAGLPVVISEHCNLPEVARHECGWVIPAEANALEASLKEVFAASAARLRGMGTKAQRLVNQNYSWATVGRQMNSVYAWLEGASLPSGVDVQLSRGKVR